MFVTKEEELYEVWQEWVTNYFLPGEGYFTKLKLIIRIVLYPYVRGR